MGEFRNAIPSQYDFFFAKHQQNLKKPFFDHVNNLIFASWSRGDRKETEILQNLAIKIFMLVDAYKRVLRNREIMYKAVNRLYELLNEVTSIEEAEKKIDDMAASG